jgi:peptidoglycan/LPS O-acetylase OafA/YrhL
MDLLLVIRGLAAISVLIWHAGGHQGDFPFINVPGRTAVWVFFGISGYVIAYGFLHGRYLLDRPGLKHFYLNRFLRIYPLFLTLSLLGWLTMWIGSGSSPIEWRDLPDQFFGLQFNHTYVLNSVFWTLGLEIQFYAIAPILMLPFFIESARWRRFAVAACYVGLLVINWAAMRYLGWSADGRNIISVLPHFVVGMVSCWLVVSFKKSNANALGYFICALACLVVSNWMYHVRPAWFWSMRGVVLVDLMIVMFVFAHASLHAPRAKALPLTRLLLWLGTLSYGIYAWHAYLMATFEGLSTSWPGLLLASVAFAYVSYRWIELPALRLKRWQGTGRESAKPEVISTLLPAPEDAGSAAKHNVR